MAGLGLAIFGNLLVKEDQVLNIWDTQRDALQAARERFGLASFAVKKIDPRDVERVALRDAGFQFSS